MGGPWKYHWSDMFGKTWGIYKVDHLQILQWMVWHQWCVLTYALQCHIAAYYYNSIVNTCCENEGHHNLVGIRMTSEAETPTFWIQYWTELACRDLKAHVHLGIDGKSPSNPWTASSSSSMMSTWFTMRHLKQGAEHAAYICPYHIWGRGQNVFLILLTAAWQKIRKLSQHLKKKYQVKTNEKHVYRKLWKLLQCNHIYSSTCGWLWHF